MPARIGKYQIESLLGEGGFGRVYKAFDPTVARPVAIKLLTTRLEPDLLKRFQNEAVSAGNLRHSNIVTIYEFSEFEGVPYIVMEYLEGDDLNLLIAARRPVGLLDKLRIMMQVGEGLAYAHDRAVVHRDVKPSNIKVQPDGVVKILDFGIARIISDTSTRATQAGDLVGSIRYMSPEQFQGAAVDALSDIFAYGEIFYELLSGAHPFEASNPSALMYRITATDPAPLTDLVPDCPPTLNDIIMRALAKERGMRYSSLQDLLFDLRPLFNELEKVSATEVVRSARGHFEAGQAEQALTRVQQAIELDPASREAHSLRDQIQKVLRQRNVSARVESLVKNAEEQMNARRFSEAVETLQMAARLDPGDVAVRENLETARQRAEAARAADRLVSEARLAVDRGDLSRAAELAKQVLQTGIDSPETRATLQAIEARVGELQKARAIDDTILAARKLYREMRFEEGIALLDDSLRRYPGEERLESAQKDLQARVQEMGQRGSPPQAPLPPSPPPPAPEEFSGATAIQPRSLRKAEPADERKPLAEAAEGRTQIFSTPSGAQMLPEVYLVFRSTVDRLLDGKPVRITKVPFEIGRAAGDLAIASDKGLSRVHAVIDWNNGAFTITDSGSSNGTYLEGRRLASGVPVPLIFWAKIHLTSATVLTFRPGALDELPDLTGELIADRYELRKAIRTGLKSVYEAHDRRLLQSVMVKLLCPGLARYPGYLEQFRREAQTAAGLKHAHICAIIDYGETSVRVPGSGMATVPYISGDFLGGGNLEDRVKLPDEIGPEKTLRWLSNISSALSCAHRKKVVHGNLKPSSIVFDAEGNASLTDFAIGNIAFDKGQKTYLATPEYMAPEEWEGAEASEATDQFALAVLAYLTLTGRRPFESSIKPEAARESFQRGPAPAHEVGAAVTAVLQKALSVDPSQRYESIKVFFEALQSAITVPAPTDFKPRVFLSYRRDESAMAARVLAMELEKRHEISVFVDTERVDSAVPFPQELARAIDRCDIFMCLLGRKTLNSSWVNEEIRLAHTLHKDMIPVFQERFAMPKSAQSLPEPAAVLLRHQAVHLLDLKGIYVDAAVDKVAKMIVESMKRKAKGKP